MPDTENQNGVDALDSLIADPKIRRVIASALLHLAKTGKSGLTAAATTLVHSFSAYQEYLSLTHRRVSTIKTFADPTKPVPLIDHFVETNLQQNSTVINQDDLRSFLSDGSKIIITALAGFGKSVLLRYLALSFYENPTGKIPIFIELRDLNRTTSPNIISYIHSLYKQTSKIERGVFEKGLKSGLFVLFLDGFDEINFEHRKSIQEQIIDLAKEYPETSIIVSSRPDEQFSSWQAFNCYGVCPMSLKQVIQLVEKIEYDENIKKKFIGKLKNGLYKKHKSFLSTPLLSTLMMLTYEQNANIPDKMHLFYLRAFETLFDKHDTYKEQYERKRKSNLRIDQFSKLFSVFCFNSYMNEKFEFSKSDIIELINDAISYCGYALNPEEVLFDLTESVCLVQIEGNLYSFVHRSFQEYFTAVFLSQCPEQFRGEFLDEFVFRPWDTVLIMLFDMAQERIEVEWVLPRLKAYVEEVEKLRGALARRALFLQWKSINLSLHGKKCCFGNMQSGQFRRMTIVIEKFYQEKFLAADSGLFSRDVDDFCLKIATSLGYEYVSLGDSKFFTSKKKRNISLSPDEKYSIENGMVKQVSLQHKILVEILNSVSDHKVVRQKFLAKVKGTRDQFI